MSPNLQPSGKTTASHRGLIPPYIVLQDFLSEGTVADLLDFALSRQSDFEPTRLRRDSLEPSNRISSGSRNLGTYREMFKSKMLGLVPELTARLKMPSFDPSAVETEIVAHGDGAFYKRHIDTQTALYQDIDQIRLLSGVYYFNAEPKSFGGGALRLYAIGDAAAEDFVDIEPLRNSFLVFPSWAPHEVTTVTCPSKRFIDSRFAINCWVHRRKTVKGK